MSVHDDIQALAAIRGRIQNANEATADLPREEVFGALMTEVFSAIILTSTIFENIDRRLSNAEMAQ